MDEPAALGAGWVWCVLAGFVGVGRPGWCWASGRGLTRDVLEEATARIMAAVAELLAGIRGERPPV
ncbi:hypothetical protein [Amycolatopsis sp. GA6-003]|uniref:hypothetical protein n=1 Tax=Amycolatopsis sp. GA6-003 TaxID=2652444 RepID=UPI003916E70D